MSSRRFMSSLPKVLITGGTGFVGSWMQKTQPSGLSCHYIGREEYTSMQWTRDRYEYYVHLANVNPAPVIDAVEWFCAKMLYCSSGIVYTTQQTEYAQNKRLWEWYCIESGVNVSIARLFTFFGKGLDDGKAYSQFVKAAREGRPLEVWGDCTRSYMHGSVMARRMWDILLTGNAGKIYDVGSTRPQTVLRLAQRISAFTGATVIQIDKDIPVKYYVPKGNL